MCNQLIGAPSVVTGVPARLRTIAPMVGSVARQESALWQLGTVQVVGVLPLTADVPTYAPKHVPATFALSGPRTCDPPA